MWTLIVAFCIGLLNPASAQEVDQQLSSVATNLAAIIKENGKKKVAILDFTDLQGGSSELGKYVAEQLTVNLVIAKKDFSVVDRANLKKILDEHKLTATGLVDPENAKKLGQFAGVDALILGTIVSKGQKVALTAKLIATDTAEIVGAAKTEFAADDSVQQLMKVTATESSAVASDNPPKEDPGVSKKFDNLGVILESVRIVNGNEYLLTVTLTNFSNTESLTAAIHCDGGGVKGSIRDPDGFEFKASLYDVEGVPVGYLLQYLGWQGSLVNLKPHDSVSGTLKYKGRNQASAGTCKVQLEVSVLRMNGPRNVAGEQTYSILADLKAK